jgi:hypothetical protein
MRLAVEGESSGRAAVPVAGGPLGAAAGLSVNAGGALVGDGELSDRAVAPVAGGPLGAGVPLPPSARDPLHRLEAYWPGPSRYMAPAESYANTRNGPVPRSPIPNPPQPAPPPPGVTTSWRSLTAPLTTRLTVKVSTTGAGYGILRVSWGEADGSTREPINFPTKTASARAMRSTSDRTIAQLHAAAGPAVITISPPAMTATVSAAVPSRLRILTPCLPTSGHHVADLTASRCGRFPEPTSLSVFGMVFEARIQAVAWGSCQRPTLRILRAIRRGRYASLPVRHLVIEWMPWAWRALPMPALHQPAMAGAVRARLDHVAGSEHALAPQAT